MSGGVPSVLGMKKLATVTTLRPRDDASADRANQRADQRADEPSTTAYWERMQALRAELAELKGAG